MKWTWCPTPTKFSTPLEGHPTPISLTFARRTSPHLKKPARIRGLRSSVIDWDQVDTETFHMLLDVIHDSLLLTEAPLPKAVKRQLQSEKKEIPSIGMIQAYKQCGFIEDEDNFYHTSYLYEHRISVWIESVLEDVIRENIDAPWISECHRKTVKQQAEEAAKERAKYEEENKARLEAEAKQAAQNAQKLHQALVKEAEAREVEQQHIANEIAKEKARLGYDNEAQAELAEKLLQDSLLCGSFRVVRAKKRNTRK